MVGLRGPPTYGVVITVWAYDSADTPEEPTLDPAKALRDQERLLASEYGASRPPHALGGEDLECDDPRDARHWVAVYSELVTFAHGLIEEHSPGWLADRSCDPLRLPESVRAMTLHARVLELHLAYWTDRLRRLGGVRGPRGDEGGGQGS